jgi:hypothetical protein
MKKKKKATDPPHTENTTNESSSISDTSFNENTFFGPYQFQEYILQTPDISWISAKNTTTGLNVSLKIFNEKKSMYAQKVIILCIDSLTNCLI